MDPTWSSRESTFSLLRGFCFVKQDVKVSHNVGDLARTPSWGICSRLDPGSRLGWAKHSVSYPSFLLVYGFWSQSLLVQRAWGPHSGPLPGSPGFRPAGASSIMEVAALPHRDKMCLSTSLNPGALLQGYAPLRAGRWPSHPLPEPRPRTDSLAAGPDPATVCPAAGVMVSPAGTEDPRVPLFPTPGPGRRLDCYTCRNTELGPRGPGPCFISMPPM